MAAGLAQPEADSVEDELAVDAVPVELDVDLEAVNVVGLAADAVANLRINRQNRSKH